MKPIQPEILSRVVKEQLEKKKQSNSWKVAIVVPAYNEEKLIGVTLSSIPNNVYRVYVVDDCSKDRTLEIMRECSEVDSRIEIIRHEKNRGVGAAIMSGYKKALEEKMDIAVVMAGDTQMDGSYLPNLLEPILVGEADYAKGNRLYSAEYRKGMSKWRWVGNAILTFLTKISSGYWQMMDPQNGYTAISRGALELIDLDSVYPKYGYCNDLLVKLNAYSMVMVDVRIPAVYGNEKSKIKYGSYIVKVSWLLLKNFFWRLKTKYLVLSFHPLILFYFFGLVVTPIGIFFGLHTIYYKYILQGALFIRGVLSMLIFMIGMQSLLFAMLFDMQMDTTVRQSHPSARKEFKEL